MQCEDEENPDRDTTNAGTRDLFIDEGLSSSSESDQNAHHARTQRQSTTRLQKAKAFREKLKER